MYESTHDTLVLYRWYELVNILEIPLKNEVNFLDFLIGSECPWAANV